MQSARPAPAGRADGAAVHAVGPARADGARRRRRSGRDRLAPFVLVAPAILIIAGFRLWPLVLGVNFSFTGDGDRDGQSVGLSNYAELWQDPVFRTALRNVGLLVLL